MKYYSELTKVMYDSVEELEKAEKEITNKTNERKKDAAEVEKAYEAMVSARKNYEKILTDFCNKHGSYHRTIKSTDIDGDITSSWNSLAHLIDILKL